MGQEDLVELALSRPLVRACVCWMTKTMARVRATTTLWKMVSTAQSCVVPMATDRAAASSGQLRRAAALTDMRH